MQSREIVVESDGGLGDQGCGWWRVRLYLVGFVVRKICSWQVTHWMHRMWPLFMCILDPRGAHASLVLIQDRWLALLHWQRHGLILLPNEALWSRYELIVAKSGWLVIWNNCSIRITINIIYQRLLLIDLQRRFRQMIKWGEIWREEGVGTEHVDLFLL